MKCPDCDVDLVPLVAGINQCPKCKKIIKSKEEKKEEKSEEQTFESGEWFMQHTSINRKYEIAEKGIIFVKNNKENIAAVICHTPEMPTIKYVRLSWFKETANLHHGMIKINEKAELQNLIKILGMFNEDFDEDFNLIKKNKSKIKQENENTKKTLDTDLFFTFDRKKCPNCGSKVKKSQNSKYYSCDACGEIVVMEDGNPIFDIPTDKLPLEYSSNFPVNFYIPVTGITFKWLMAEWKAVCVIYAKENPDKKWLRFYWWTRDLQSYISSEYRMDTNAAAALAWNAKKGSGSTNIYEKSQIPPMIKALLSIQKELGW